MDKKELRKELLEKRKSLNDVSSLLIIDLINSEVLDKYHNIGIYYPLKGEINILPIMDYFKDKKFYFPKTIGNDIQFYQNTNKFKKGPFNVMEPVSDVVVLRDTIDVFIIPCVGITEDNKRIGYGKGYYDRYLDSYKGFKIALNYKELSNLDFNADKYDVKLDYVLVR